MSWISSSFCDEGPSMPPPSKRSKTTTTSKTGSPAFKTPQTPSWNSLRQDKPRSVDDLAVHVKKVRELQSWLEQSTNFNSKAKFLLLTGPSGCGKTTALQSVCHRLGFKILEWITPLDKPADNSEFQSRFELSQSAAKQFQEYLFRSSRYSSCFSSNPTRKLVLVKDFPNVFIHNPSTFHEILQNFSEKCVNPVVFICGNESHCRKLFSLDLKDSCQLQTITFNSIPDQRMFKVLKTLLLKETKTNKSIKMLSDEAIFAICAASQGDLRSAISKLKFCSISSNFDFAQLKTQGKFKKRKSTDENVPTDKDKRIDFFHGIGRVLYPKKIESETGVRFVHSTEAIVENVASEPNSFISQLHENYPSKLGNVYDLSEGADRLSKSDILMSRWQEKNTFQEYGLSVAVQGLMVCNKTPLKTKFEPFRRDQTSRMEVDSKAIELEGKSAFADLGILDYLCLVDILPYSRLLLPNLNPGQLEYIRKTGHNV